VVYRKQILDQNLAHHVLVQPVKSDRYCTTLYNIVQPVKSDRYCTTLYNITYYPKVLMNLSNIFTPPFGGGK